MLLIIGLPIVLLIVFLGGQEPSQTASERPRITAAQERARLELNEAAQSYREGNFSEARRHAEAAYEYDPQNKTAPQFIARILHRQYKPGDQSPENVTQALAAIEAYRRILADDAQNDEAYKAIASLYGAIREDQQQRQWILQRAVDATFSAEKRSEAYVILASKDWHCANLITDSPANKKVLVKKYRAVIRYQKPRDEAQFQQAKYCLENGLTEIEIAIALTPESETAWSYKTNLLFEGSKLAEMEGQKDRKADFDQQAGDAQRRTDDLSRKQKQQNTEADGSTERPEPPPPKRPERFMP